MLWKKIARLAGTVIICLSVTSGFAQATLIVDPSFEALDAGFRDRVATRAAQPIRPFDGTRWSNDGGSQYPARWSHHTFTSSAMGGQSVGYTLYLPPNYATQPAARFPVVYMLHGRGGNENTWAGMFNPSCCIIVGVNGGKNGKYLDAVADSPMSGVYMSESAILELVSHVDATYRTQANAGGRALQGFSMGGFGAFRLGFKHPEMWSSIYTFSAAIHQTVANLPAEEPALLAAMLGGDASLFEAERAQTLATFNTAAIIASGIAIRGAVGGRDELKSANIDMYNLLNQLGIPNEGLTIVPGVGHDKGYVPALDPIGWAMANFTLGMAGFELDAVNPIGPVINVSAIPEPSTFVLFGMGLLSLFGMRLLRSKQFRLRFQRAQNTYRKSLPFTDSFPEGQISVFASGAN